MTNGIIPSSFRDPSGFVFCQDGSIYRQVNTSYKDQYDHLMASGLYDSLVNSELLIPHEEVNAPKVKYDKAYRVIEPEPIPFISYPYEWCFSQWKDAALSTLRIQRIALDFGMSLKDASAYNIQFRKGKPVFIDTLSFERYREGNPWVAYRQFCQHFLAPLTLMSYKDIRLSQLFRVHMDGIPLELTSSLLPVRTYFKISSLIHLHLHAMSQKRHAARSFDHKLVTKSFSLHSFRGLIDSLESSIQRLTWHPPLTEWNDYYGAGNRYESQAMEHKKQLVADFLDEINPETVWDLGANTGLFSRIASRKGIETISFDMDSACVEKNYLEVVAEKEPNILPLLLDLTNPSPQLGWLNQERMSIFERGPVQTVLSLALIHHLAISNNLPLDHIARFFRQIGSWLIIEFIPKTDSQVQRLLSTRKDIFHEYTQENFEAEFGNLFLIKGSVKISDSQRTLYLMEGK